MNINKDSLILAFFTGVLAGSSADLSGADLTGAELAGAEMSDVNWTNIYLSGATMPNESIHQ